MGSRGPVPTPTPILKARGSWLVNQRKNEPKAPEGKPECPDWLNKDAQKNWDAVVPLLEEMRVLSKADGNALARYCALLVRWKKEYDFIEKHGTTYPVKRNGEVLFKLFPSVKVFDMLTTQLGRLEQCFGLNPSARSRIALQDQDHTYAGDDKQRYLRMG